MGNRAPFNIDYVYTPVNTEELRSVNISLIIKNETMEFLISSDCELEIADLENIINSIQEYQFNTMRINIAQDCKVYLKVGAIKYEVIFSSDKSKIEQFITI